VEEGIISVLIECHNGAGKRSLSCRGYGRHFCGLFSLRIVDSDASLSPGIAISLRRGDLQIASMSKYKPPIAYRYHVSSFPAIVSDFFLGSIHTSSYGATFSISIRGKRLRDPE
jgi:hypothetical protein